MNEDPKDDNLPAEGEAFQIKGYLSPSQIEIVKGKTNAASFDDQVKVVQLIDAFVKSNGKVDDKYTDLMDALKKIELLAAAEKKYPDRIRQSLPILYSITFFDYLYLVGVFSEKDIQAWQEKLAQSVGLGPQQPPVYKA